MFWVVVATVSANCEPWCSEPCTVLNGNVQVECGGCDVRGSGCFPGAQGYDDRAERNAAFHNGRELGGLSPATPVDDPESLLAPSCTTLRCKRVRQKRRIERQRAEEQAVLEAQTKRAALGGPSKPSRRPSRRESARRAPESDVKFGQPRHDGRSAGGVDVPCELQRIGYDEILSFTPDQRRALFEKPTIVTGLIDEWPALRNWTDPRRFAARFGHHRFLAKRVRFGIERAATMGIAYERMQHSVSVAELVQHTESELQKHISDSAQRIYAMEQSECCERICCGPNRSLTLHVHEGHDQTGNTIGKIHNENSVFCRNNTVFGNNNPGGARAPRRTQLGKTYSPCPRAWVAYRLPLFLPA